MGNSYHNIWHLLNVNGLLAINSTLKNQLDRLTFKGAVLWLATWKGTHTYSHPKRS